MIIILFFIAVVSSLISQIPMILESGLDTYLKLSWVPLTGVLILLYPSNFFEKKNMFFPFFMIVFGLYCITAHGINGFDYFVDGNDYYNMAISMMIFLDCYVFWKHFSSDRIYKWVVVLIYFSCILLGTIVYIFFLKDADITSTVYAFKAKNSMGQILFVGFILALTGLKLFNNRLVKSTIFVSSLYLLFIILQLRSRATILCVFFAAVYYVCKLAPSSQRLKYVLMAFLILLFVLLNPVTYDLLVNNIIFANRDSSSMDSLSSGRSSLVKEAITQIFSYPMLGVGNEYLDCMPIAMILQYGIIGASIVFILIIYVSIKVNTLPIGSPLTLATFLLFWSYILNSLFEAYPPFGPGAKCFPLWMLIGFALAKDKSNKKDQPRNSNYNL